MMLNSPCHRCENRKPICHDNCTSYKEFKATNELVRHNRNAYKNEIDINIESTERANKRKRRGKR